jgi:hypothetical protein
MCFCVINILSRVLYPFVGFNETPKHKGEVKERGMVEEGTNTFAVSGMHVLALSCFAECCFGA